MDNIITLKKIMAMYCAVPYKEIDLTKAIQDRYVPKEEQDDFASEICDKWPNCDCTDLHNQLFSSIKTGNDIIKFITNP